MVDLVVRGLSWRGGSYSSNQQLDKDPNERNWFDIFFLSFFFLSFF